LLHTCVQPAGSGAADDAEEEEVGTAGGDVDEDVADADEDNDDVVAAGAPVD